MADNWEGVDPTVAFRAQALINASGGRIYLVSGHRTREEQQVLYNRYRQGRGPVAAKPGNSQHEHGRAIDFGGDKQLLARLAPQFGFERTVPSEDWHYELVGNRQRGAGGGGGGGASSTSVPASGGGAYGQDLGYRPSSPEEAKEVAKSMYGYLGWYVDHEEVGPIIVNAAMQGWDVNRLIGALTQTRWWRTTSESARQWDALKISDPATAERRVDETALSLNIQSQNMGLGLSRAKLSEIAVHALRYGWNKDEMQLALASEMQYDPARSNRGVMGYTMNQVRALGAEYMVPVDERQAFQWARRIISGGGDMGGVQAQMQKLAKARFPQIAQEIAQGVTPKQFFDPYQNAVAEVLDVAPSSVNFMDRRWSPIISFRGRDGDLRPMTISEAQRYARMQPEWQNSSNGWETATQAGAQIMEMFGEVA